MLAYNNEILIFCQDKFYTMQLNLLNICNINKLVSFNPQVFISAPQVEYLPLNFFYSKSTVIPIHFTINITKYKIQFDIFLDLNYYIKNKKVHYFDLVK